MKIAIHTNDKEQSLIVAKTLEQLLIEEAIVIDNEQPDIVVSIGGDGTLLSAFHRYNHFVEQVKFVAIHTGSLGFYTDFLAQQIDELVEAIKLQQIDCYSYPLLNVTLQSTSGVEQTTTALNEMTLKTVSGTLVCDIYIGDMLFEVFRGDGICISTPTGSTGMSKSLGGAVLHPKVDAMQLVEIAAINNLVYRTVDSPLILPKDDHVKLVIRRAISPVMSIDNLEPQFINCDEIMTITVALSKQRIQFLNIKQIDFWARVESAFIGEIDKEALNVAPSTRRYHFVKKTLTDWQAKQ